MMRLATGEAAAVESTCTAYVLEARNSASRDLASSSEAAWRGWGCARELSAAAARPTLPRSRIRRLLADRVPPAGDSWWCITITGQRAIDRGEHTEPCIPPRRSSPPRRDTSALHVKQLPPWRECDVVALSVPECVSQDTTHCSRQLIAHTLRSIVRDRTSGLRPFAIHPNFDPPPAHAHRGSRTP